MGRTEREKKDGEERERERELGERTGEGRHKD